MSALASFIGGSVAIILLTVAAPSIARFATRFGPVEMFTLVLFGISTVIGLSGRSVAKGLAMALLGALLGVIGPEVTAGYIRYGFHPELRDGLNFIAVVIGLFGVSEVLVRIEKPLEVKVQTFNFLIREILPSRQELLRYWRSIARCSLIGWLVGVLPGAGGTLASFLAYSVERSASKTPEKFGQGAMEGVIASESADNAAVGGSLIPLMALGIPGSGGTAILLGALVMYGLRPGPLFFTQSGDVAWTVISSLYISNTILLLTNVFAIPLFVMLINIGLRYLNGIVIALCFVGAFSLSFSSFDIWVTLLFGVFGYFMKKLDYPPAPLIMGLVLAPLAETALARSLMLSQGNLAIFIERPIAAVFLILALLSFVFPLVQLLRRVR
jgi:putative tricarboxylic transport membrane protein